MARFLSAVDNGTHNAFKIVSPCTGTMEVSGTFGSATATLKISTDAGTTFRNFQAADSTGTVGNVAWTANEIKAANPFPAGSYQLVVSGGTGTGVNLDVSALGVIQY